MNYTIHQGDNRDTLKTLEDNSVDAIVTDPPYGIDFLGKSWDANTGALETYQECLRVLKPGGYILAFSAARTYHHLAITLEQAGFEIRDQLMWLYASGFPKAQDIGKAIQKRQGVEEYKEYKHNVPVNGGAGDTKHYENEGEIVPTSPLAKQWSGWKTALKPAHEPICMARKPFKGSTIDNVLAHGVGALNIDAIRIPFQDEKDKESAKFAQCPDYKPYDPEQQIDYSVEGGVANRKMFFPNEQGRYPSNVLGEIAEGYQKYFYCPKVSRKERHVGFEGVDSLGKQLYDLGGYWIVDNEPQPFSGSAPANQCYLPGVGNIYVHGLNHELEKIRKQQKINKEVGNNHPTVKPVELMKYLIKLVTPPNSTVLDPFTGSGSTGMAAVELGHEFIGCELDPNYVNIATTRIQAWNTEEYHNTFGELFE
jgi:DNA modification methylase